MPNGKRKDRNVRKAWRILIALAIVTSVVGRFVRAPDDRLIGQGARAEESATERHIGRPLAETERTARLQGEGKELSGGDGGAAADDSGRIAAEPPSESPKEVQQRLLRRIAAGLMVLVAVALVGLLLMVVAILWGRRVRRVAKSPLPSADPPAPLWFLRVGSRAQPLRGDRQDGGAADRTPDDAGDQESDPRGTAGG